MNLCLFCLSLVDGMYVFVFTVANSYCLVRVFRPDLETWWKWTVRSYVIGLYAGLLQCSGSLTMIISVERCVCVFLPFRATSLIRTRTMAVIIFTAIAAIQGICMIYPLKVSTVLYWFWIRFCCCCFFFLSLFFTFSCQTFFTLLPFSSKLNFLW